MTETTEEIVKANLTDEMTDEQFVQSIVKANLPNTDEIVKAKVDEITKAFETTINELKAEITKIKEQPIMKSAVIIPEQAGTTDLNYAAVDQFNKRG